MKMKLLLLAATSSGIVVPEWLVGFVAGFVVCAALLVWYGIKGDKDAEKSSNKPNKK